LRANTARVAADFSPKPFKAKHSSAEQLRVHTPLVSDSRSLESGVVSVTRHCGGPQGAQPKEEATAAILPSPNKQRVFPIR